MEFDYETEKGNLKKKLVIFIVIAIGFTVFFRIAMGNDVSTLSCIFTGVLLGLVFYIPGRLQEYMRLGLIATIIMSVIFLLILWWLSDVIGQIVFLIALLLPLADIGYSIHRIVTARKNMKSE